jgi:hypothetical protein
MPQMSTVMLWLREDREFSQQYARAREAQADYFADEIVEIADAAMRKDARGVQAARLAVDARKWAASKLLPKKYGDRIDAHVSAETELSGMTDEELERRIVALATELGIDATKLRGKG